MATNVLCEKHDSRIALLTLNRPDKRNALTIDLMDSYVEWFRKLESDRDCRAVIVRGAGPAFCSGLDLVEATDPSSATQSARCVARTLQATRNSDLVTIAAVHGVVCAGGAGLMSSCDYVVGTDDLRISFPEVRRGLVPAFVAGVLATRLRDSEMRELFLLAEPIDVHRAVAIGLVQRVVDHRDLIDEAVCVARAVCKGGPEAVRQTKRIVRQASAPNHSDPIESALEMHLAARAGGEAAEGLAAFHEKREPDWESGQ